MKYIFNFSFIVFLVCLISSCAISTLRYYPPISGIVLKDGEPVKSASITFVVINPHLKDNNMTFLATTDSNGKFNLPEAANFLYWGPHYHISEQILLIKAEGNTYIGLDGVRDYISDYNRGLTVELSCDIAKPPSSYEILYLNGNHYELKNHKDYPKIQNNYSYKGICITSRSTRTRKIAAPVS